MRIAFLLPKVHLAGGIYIVLEHARGLAERHGHDVTIVLTRDRTFRHDYPSLKSLRCVGIDEVAGDVFDLAVSTWWETAYSLPRLRSGRYAHFIQNTEDRFYTTEEATGREQAAAVLNFPIAYIATSSWLERQLRAVQPEISVYRVLSGIDKEVFSLRAPTPPREGEPLKIVVEGHQSVWFKGVGDALEAVRRMREPRHLTVISGEDRPSPEAKALGDVVLGRLSHQEMADVFADAHVLLKLSRVEGMFGPPLEAFHRGATAVIAPVTGHDEYAVHGSNCLIVGFDDPVGTARTLDLLARDRELLQTLRSQAHDTAATWPDWREATNRLAEVVEDIVTQEAPSSTEYARRLILETQRAQNRIDPAPEYALASPSVIEKLRWVVEHEGPRGVVSRGTKKAVSSTHRLRESARARAVVSRGAERAVSSTHRIRESAMAVRQASSAARGKSRSLTRDRPETLKIPGLDRYGLRWLQSAIVTREISKEEQALCIVRRRKGELSCKYPGGWVTLDGMGPPHILEDTTREVYFYDHVPAEGSIVVQVGAGIGTELLPLARLVGPSGKVVAIEPHPGSFARMKVFCQLNRLENVLLVQAAATDKKGTCFVSDVEDYTRNSTVIRGDRPIEVPSECLDDVVAGLELERIDMLLMNIEGAETAALGGFRRGISCTRSVAIACHDFLADSGDERSSVRTKADVTTFLVNEGFDVVERPEHHFPWINDFVYGRRAGDP